MLIIRPNDEYKQPAQIMVHGMTGDGKTWHAAEGGRPLVILTEKKAVVTYRSLNRDAIIMYPETMQDWEELKMQLAQREKFRNCTRVVVDSFTELTNLLGRIYGVQRIQDYGTLKTQAMTLMHLVQALPIPTMIVVRSKVIEYVGGLKRIVPMGLGSSVDDLPGHVMATFQARKDFTDGTVGVRYILDSSPTEEAQRSGFIGVPAVWERNTMGNIDELLQLITTGQPIPGGTFEAWKVAQGGAPSTAPTPSPVQAEPVPPAPVAAAEPAPVAPATEPAGEAPVLQLPAADTPAFP